MKTIDLNCDLGESFGVYGLGFDEEAIKYVTSINIACGFHASDPVNMMKTVQLAKKYGVNVGAHPSYPDLVGFGRRAIAATAKEIKADMIYQIGALKGFCAAEKVEMKHVKVHGALYNAASEDLTVALAIAEGIAAVDEKLIMVAMADSQMVKAAKEKGIRCLEEVFADRNYDDNGRLLSRRLPEAVIYDVGVVTRRVLRMAEKNEIVSVNGKVLHLKADTVCVHGDTAGAVKMMKSIAAVLTKNGIALCGVYS